VADEFNPGVDWVTLAKSGTLDLRGADLRGADLDGINMELSYLTGADFSGASLEGANLSCSWMGARKHRPKTLEDIVSNGRVEWDVGLDGVRSFQTTGKINNMEELLPYDESADFSNANLRGVVVNYSICCGVKFNGADLTGAEFNWQSLFEYADFTEAILVDAVGLIANYAILKGAIMTGSDLSSWELRNVNMQRADLRRVNLYGVKFGQSDLTGANLEGANLEEVRFGESNLTLANLEGANLKGVKLGNCRLHGANISNAIVDEPEEFLKRGAQYL
jgi:uncharacterized protein YjbI with pentapeptide repeats